MEIIKPKLRFLIVRHGESLGNVDPESHKRYSDNALPLTSKGIEQAKGAGVFINAFLSQPWFLEEHQKLREQRRELIATRQKFLAENKDFANAYPEFAAIPKELPEKPKVRLWYGPFVRTQETKDGILQYAADVITDCRENPFIYEKLFGLMDGLSRNEAMQLFPIETKHINHYYANNGKHYAPMPLGESGAEVETRCKHAISTLRRDADKSDTYTNVIVTHGYTSRLIAKILMNQSVSTHAKEQNPGNCWVRYISGHAGEPKNDYGWVYTGNRSHLSKLIENATTSQRTI